MVHAKQHVGVVLGIIVMMIGMSQPCLAEKTFVFCSVPDIPPLSFEEDGIVKGFFLDVFREVARRAGFEITLTLYPLKRLEVYLQSGEVDGAIAMVHTKEREEYLVYSPLPIMVSRLLVFVKKGREFPFTSINDLKGKKIGVIRGWKTENLELEQAIREGTIQVEEVAHYDQNLKKLMVERIDCFISTEQLTWYYANELGVAKDLVALETPIAEHSVFPAISKYAKNIVDPQEFIQKMNTALDEVLSDGTYEQLQKQYKVTSLK